MDATPAGFSAAQFADREAIYRVMMRDTWFSGQPPAFREQVLAMGKLADFGDGQPIFMRGEPAQKTYSVLSGQVRIEALTPDGTGALLGLRGPGYWFGVISLFDNHPRIHNAVASGPTTLFCIHKRDFDRFVSDNSDAYRCFTLLLAEQARMAFEHDRARSIKSPAAILAKLLLEIEEMFGDSSESGQPVQCRLTQDDLSELAGVTRQSIWKTMRRWRDEEVIHYHYGNIAILNRSALDAEARD
jgi:CRP/FNR family cyclic AMP-dependent transcriptional regulator